MTSAEVIVIGAGPAGIAAAIAAAENGRDVVVLVDNPSAGGQIWRPTTIQEGPAKADPSAKGRALERLDRSRARVLVGRSVFSADEKGLVQTSRTTPSGTFVERHQFKQLIIATGARERFLPFPGWTLPGVFGAGGLQALVKGGYPVAGKRIVVAGTGPLLLAVAAHLAKDGAVVEGVLEQASLEMLAPFAASLASHPGKIMQGIKYRARLWRTPYRTGSWVLEALASKDGMQLSAVRVTDGRRTWEEPCDLLAIGYHLVPNTEVAVLLGCALTGSFVRVDATQRTSVPNVFCVGEPTGIAGLDSALLEGEIAGLTCAGHSTEVLQKRALKERVFGQRIRDAFALRDELRSLPSPETIVCRCEDVKFENLQGHTSWTDAKLQTRCGMGPCQGRICGPAVEHLLGWRPVSVREPLFPLPLHAFCLSSERMDTKNRQLTKEKV